MFRCPACHAALDDSALVATMRCAYCPLEIGNVEGVPLLVSDRTVIDTAIEAARQRGRDRWYSDPQLTQWSGPYRHHVLKRKQWLEGVLARWKAGHKDAAVALDLGCGDGVNLTWLHKHFARLYGSDYNILRLMRAAKLGLGVRLFMADILNYPTVDGAFDVIFFNHVLEHIRDDEAALCEVRRILKPGGLLTLGVPNEGAAFWQFAHKDVGQRGGKQRHKTPRQRKGLPEIAELVGARQRQFVPAVQADRSDDNEPDRRRRHRDERQDAGRNYRRDKAHAGQRGDAACGRFDERVPGRMQ